MGRVTISGLAGADQLKLLWAAILCSLALVVPVSAQRTFRFDSDFIPVLVPDNGCVSDAAGAGEGGASEKILINAAGRISDVNVK